MFSSFGTPCMYLEMLTAYSTHKYVNSFAPKESQRFEEQIWRRKKRKKSWQFWYVSRVMECKE